MKFVPLHLFLSATLAGAALVANACSDEGEAGTSDPSTSSGGVGGSGGSSGGGGTVGAGAMGGGASASGGYAGGGGCVPANEICNGLDDDCDGVADNGCPIDVALANGGFAGHTQFGNTNDGTAFSDPCAPGSAIYRMSGYVGGDVGRLEAHCATLSLAVDKVSMPYVHTITRGPDLPLGAHGQAITTAFDVSCPANEFVVGIDGQASAGGLHDLTIHCAALIIAGAPGTFSISHGATTTFTIDGTNTGPTYADLLTATEVVERYRGRAGAWVDAIGIGSADVELVLHP